MTGQSPIPDFSERVKLRAYDDKYIDKIEERDILQQGLELGMTLDQAKDALAAICLENGYIMESVVFRDLLESLCKLAQRNGGLSRASFHEACGLGSQLLGNLKGEIAVKRMVCRLIDDHGVPIRKKWFSNWYASVKRDLGLC